MMVIRESGRDDEKRMRSRLVAVVISHNELEEAA
jgi:hypothetical protein